MNTTPDRRVVGWAAVYTLAAVMFLGFVAGFVAIYQQSTANGDTAQRVEEFVARIDDCLNPHGVCGERTAKQRLAFAEVLDRQRHRDLASALICLRRLPVPPNDIERLERCIERRDKP